jgi:hypothetical protein
MGLPHLTIKGAQDLACLEFWVTGNPEVMPRNKLSTTLARSRLRGHAGLQSTACVPISSKPVS